MVTNITSTLHKMFITSWHVDSRNLLYTPFYKSKVNKNIEALNC